MQGFSSFSAFKSPNHFENASILYLPLFNLVGKKLFSEKNIEGEVISPPPSSAPAKLRLWGCVFLCPTLPSQVMMI
jgi:hypothetical protein